VKGNDRVKYHLVFVLTDIMTTQQRINLRSSLTDIDRVEKPVEQGQATSSAVSPSDASLATSVRNSLCLKSLK